MYRSLSKSTAALLATPKPSLHPSSSLSSAPRQLSRAVSSVPDPDDQSSADPISRKLEEVIHRIIVRRSAPDWLPFVPGSSYWVPPRQTGDGSLFHVLERLAHPVADIEPLSTASARGWPSPDFFIHGVYPEELAAKVSSNEAEEGIGSSQFSDRENEEG